MHSSSINSIDKGKISYGDTVILRFGGKTMCVDLAENGVLNSHHGRISHSSIVDQSYGAWITISDKEVVQILKFDSLLWLQNLNHRTQILYEADISVILAELEIRPGNIVFESGTGSGCLSHFIADAVGFSGQLHTFEFHRQRYVEAVNEFKKHHLDEIISVYHADVVADGFAPVKLKADSIFLDLPNPSLVVHHCLESAKCTGTRLAAFSPCIEQVQKLTECLGNNCAVTDIRVMECLKRDFDSVKINKRGCIGNNDDNPRYVTIGRSNAIGHTGYLMFCNLFNMTKDAQE